MNGALLTGKHHACWFSGLLPPSPQLPPTDAIPRGGSGGFQAAARPPADPGAPPGGGGADTGVTERHRSHSTKELDTLAGCLGSTTTWLTDSERQNQLSQVGNRALPQGRGAARSSPVLSRALWEITVLYSL